MTDGTTVADIAAPFTSPPSVSLSLLGSPSLTIDGEPPARSLPAKTLALLAYLAMEPRRQHSREELTALLWPEADGAPGRNSLRQTLHVLRQVLPATPATFQISRQSIGLDDPQSPIPHHHPALPACGLHGPGPHPPSPGRCLATGPADGGTHEPGELRQAVEEPARNRGVRFESGLVERLLADVGGDPGNLPLLQFCLTQLWGRQTAGTLTHAAYDDIGGLAGALSRYAEHVFEGLSDDQQTIARPTLTRLVQPGEETADTRRWANRQELSEAGWVLVQALADALAGGDRSHCPRSGASRVGP